MFCNSENTHPQYDLSCGMRWFPEIISFFSLIFSLFVAIVTIKRVRLSLINKLILQIIFSEILDGLNILLCAVADAQGKPLFENYLQRRFVCFSQIYIGVFTCLWTLTASLFISLRMYDVMIKRDKGFQNFMIKYSTTLSVLVPCILSFIIWTIQVSGQAGKWTKLSEEQLYNPSGVKRDHFKHMYCWVDTSLNFVVLILVITLICMNIYFSIFRGMKYINEISDGIKKENVDQGRLSIQKQMDKIDHIKYTLWIYPLASSIMWGIFFIFQVLCDLITTIKTGPFAWIYIILISVRQPIYTFMLCYTQNKIKDCCIDVLFCKGCVNKGEEKPKLEQIQQIKEGSGMFPQESLIA